MVGKLIKYELIRIARIAAVPAMAMVVLSIALRVSIIDISDSNILFPVFLIFYAIAAVATLVVCVWVGIVRFYRTLFTGEGYMTFSLPVTCDQIIISKLLSAIIAVACGGLVCSLSLLIVSVGQSVSPQAIFESIVTTLEGYLRGLYIIYVEGGALSVAENIILSIALIPESFLLFYLVMSIAQLANKNRVLIAVALYFGGALAVSIFSSLAGVRIAELLIGLSPHVYAWVQIAFIVAVDIGCYLVVRHIIKNKVNLLT